MNGAADEAMGNGQLLLVDDDVNLAEEIIEFGQWNDLNISYAKNAYVCLETIRRYPEIELVIMDLRLPDVLGTELIRMIRTEFKDRPWLQFIVLTGFADLESAREVIKLGAVDMLNKPFQPREFTTAAHKGLVRARRARSGPIQPGDIITAEDFDKAHGWPDQASSWYQRLHQAARQRSRLFPADLFSDPCWDMVLELYLAESSRKTLTTHDVCVVSRLPISTALRRLEALEARGFIVRQRDVNDRRRSLVMLTERARELLTRYASSCRSVVTT